IGDVLAVLGPVLHDFLGWRLQKRRLLADAAAGLGNVDIAIALPVSSERDAPAVRRPDRSDVIGRVQSHALSDSRALPVDHPDIGEPGLLFGDGDELAVGREVEISVRAGLAGVLERTPGSLHPSPLRYRVEYPASARRGARSLKVQKRAILRH